MVQGAFPFWVVSGLGILLLVTGFWDAYLFIGEVGWLEWTRGVRAVLLSLRFCVNFLFLKCLFGLILSTGWLALGVWGVSSIRFLSF